MIELVLNVVLGLIAVAVLVSMWRFHVSQDDHYRQFNLIDLITTKDGIISRPAVMEFGVFLLMGWGFIVLVNKSALPEWYVTVLVGAFALRAAHSAYLSSKKKDVPGNGS